MDRTIRVVIIDIDPNARRIIHEALTHLPNISVIADTDSLIYGYEIIRQNKPDLVFLDLREDPSQSLDMVSRITTYFKQTVVFVSGSELNLDFALAGMQAGAREYLVRPFDQATIIRIIEKHYRALTTDLEQGDTTGRLITVFSNKGGLGKTTMAVNLAMALSKVTGKSVALVDLNLQLGDITTFLDIVPKQTIVDIARNISRVDAAYLEASLAQFKRNDCHVYILADPLFVEEAEEVTADQINTILTVLKAVFEYVIVDTTTTFDSKTLTAMDLADQILLMSMINLPTIRSTQRVLTLFDRLGYSEQKVKIVVNRYIADEEITIEDVEETLEYPVYWKVPNNYNVVINAINRGAPIMDIPGSEELWQNYLSLARQISGVISHGDSHAPMKQAGTRPGLLGGLFGKG